VSERCQSLDRLTQLMFSEMRSNGYIVTFLYFISIIVNQPSSFKILSIEDHENMNDYLLLL
jgi:hypothetical protein